jgi:HNH endonuclease
LRLPDIPGVQFKNVPGYPGYCVGDDGSVWSSVIRKGCKTQRGWRPLKLIKSGRYLGVCLCRDGKSKRFRVHRLILETFISPRPDKMEARHFPDRDVTNNRLDNLRWGTSRENNDDLDFHGTRPRGSYRRDARFTEADIARMYDLAEAGWGPTRIAQEYGAKSNHISSILRGKIWAGTVPGRTPPLAGKPRLGAVLNESMVSLVRELAGNGIPKRQIARQLKINEKTVSRAINLERPQLSPSPILWLAEEPTP